MNRSDSDLSMEASRRKASMGSTVRRASTLTSLSLGYSLKPTQFVAAADAAALAARAKNVIKKSPYLQPERRKLKAPFDFSQRARSFALANTLSAMALGKSDDGDDSDSDSDAPEADPEAGVKLTPVEEKKEKERTDVGASL